MKIIIEHKDRIGQILSLNDLVAYPVHNHLEVGIITKLNAKMVRVKKVEAPKKWESKQLNRYPNDCVKIEGPIVSMYLIKHSGEK